MKAGRVFLLTAWAAFAAQAVFSAVPTATPTPSLPGSTPAVSTSFYVGFEGARFWDKLAGTEYGGQSLTVKLQNDSDDILVIATAGGDIWQITPHTTIYRYDLTGNAELRVLFSYETCLVTLEWHP